jgi:hypothetical protein
VAAAGVGVAVGTYINNHTKISDTAASAGTWVEQSSAGTWVEQSSAGTWVEQSSAGTWVEQHITGGSVIAGATAAAATSIVTAPYYAGVAAVDAGGKALNYAEDNLTLNPSEIDWDRTLDPRKWF